MTLRRVAALRWFCRFPLWLLIGALAALGQEPLNWWPATVLGLALAFAIFQTTDRWQQAAWRGWWIGTGYFLASLNWIVEPFLVDAARYGWMALPALYLLSAGLALFWALSFGVARALGRGGAGWIGVWLLAELLRSYLFTGFPWAQPGHVLINTGALGWAAYVGAPGLNAAVLAAAIGLRKLLGHARLLGAALLAGLAALMITGPMVSPPPAVPGDAPTVRLVQPNATQSEKWDRAKIPEFFARQLDFTRAEGDPDLIVWPETAIASLLASSGPAFAAMSEAAGDAPVAVGLRRLEEGRRLYNTLALIDGEGQVAGLYDKHHLVPFGEYIPFGNVLGRYGLRGLAAEDGFGFSSGPGPTLMDIPGLGPALPLICYESIFPRNLRGTGGRARFILLVTNDAWFGQISGPYQHLAQARLRSAEQGLPMVRVANTGISAMIDSAGQITGSLPLGQAGWIDRPLPPAKEPTLYAAYGDWPMIGLAVLLLGAGFAARLRPPRVT